MSLPAYPRNVRLGLGLLWDAVEEGGTGGAGPQGNPGTPGVDGDDGAPGADGADGAPGAPGTTDYNALSNKPTLGTAAAQNVVAFATAAQGVDARTPTAHTHGNADLTGLAASLAGKAATAHTHVPSDITGTAVVTADARLSDARTPLAHNQSADTITTGTVATARLGSGTANSGTFLRGDQTWAAPAGGSSDLVYAAAGADVAINNAADVTVVTRDVTGVGATDILDVTADFVILNNSTATRVYVITLDFDGLFDVEFTTGALATSATVMHPFTVRGVLGIRSTSLAIATFVCEGQLAAGIASGTDTTMAATHLRASGWGETASNASGTCTVALKVRSAANPTTQTCRLLNFQIRKATPT